MILDRNLWFLTSLLQCDDELIQFHLKSWKNEEKTLRKGAEEKRRVIIPTYKHKETSLCLASYPYYRLYYPTNKTKLFLQSKNKKAFNKFSNLLEKCFISARLWFFMLLCLSFVSSHIIIFCKKPSSHRSSHLTMVQILSKDFSCS